MLSCSPRMPPTGYCYGTLCCLPYSATVPLPVPPPSAAVAVVGACLFPLAPNWAKVGVFYLTAGLLALILGVLALRG